MEAFHNYILFLVLILTLKIQQQGVSAAQHVVGGSQGWDVSTDFSTWVSSQTFKPDDQLVFKYTSGLHSVVELADENAYKSCQISKSLNSMSSGNDVVKLNKQGTRYFACGTPGHCTQGMKVKISTTTTSSSSSSSSSSPTTTSTASGAAFVRPSFAPFSFMGMSFLVVLILQPYFCLIE